MSPQKLLFVIVLVFYGFQADARICADIDVRNSVRNLENQLRGCTVVVGHLKIVLLEHQQSLQDAQLQLDIRNITFPELTEITGFLLLFRVYGVTSIGKLFPNLTVIRGDTLLVIDYALVIHELPDLKEIGLYNLRHIGKGSTRIAKCPQLCFVNTIDWSNIGAPLHTLHYHNANLGDCAFCPKHCNGYCWNSNQCQIIQGEECDSQCLGCTKSHPHLCKACSSMYLDGGKCVAQCPETKLRNSETRTCITEQECSNIARKWWNFNGECMRKCPDDYAKVSEEDGWCRYCGDDCYEKICAGGIIDNLGKAALFRGCTHINGSLQITASTAALANELQDILGKVKEIDGFLKIYRSHAISSLYFLKKLKVISGNKLSNGRYSLLVYENQNMRKLWNWDNFTLKIEQGKMFFHYNPLLCLSEVDKLVDVAAMSSDHSVTDISPISNGDRTVCRLINLNVTIDGLESTTAKLNWKELDVESHDLVIGYTLHYIEDPLGNITLAYGRDECFGDEWDSKFVTEIGYLFYDLNPYTQYALYIQVHTISPASGGFTTIQRFRTLPADPSSPVNIRVVLTTTNSIILAWDPPEYPGGVITHYKIGFDLVEDDMQFLTQRNYCSEPHHFILEKSDDEEEPLEVWTNSSCCKRQNWQEWKRFKRAAPANHIIELKMYENTTKYEIKNLQPFKLYTLLIAACNDSPGCSSPTLVYQRTQPKEDADDIPPGVSVAVNNLNDSNILVKWLEPPAPNTAIVSYLIEYKRADFEHSVNSLQCVTRQDYQKDGYRHTISNLLPGNYFLTVKAVSLAGPGKPSEMVEFEISTVETPSSSWAYLIAVTILFVVLLASGIFYYYRSKTINRMLLINSHSTESLYVEGQYELLREDVDVPNQEPRGAFGITCNGLIKSQNRPCTVKFAQKYSDRRELAKLIKEATTMKFFNSYHLVNLLGIVSKNQPALVVMELMAWGDLKSFLRQSKDSRANITPVEMYRMAAEIADGMMYLSSKKFVHKDLAARNCLVSAGQTVKIVNFGINKDMYKTDYYKKNSGEVIPVRWMAPESLADGIFSDDSNVWSYGIVLWEIVTLAEQPYEKLSDEEVTRFVIGQKVLEPPPDCPELLYEMMVACWRWRSKHRPIFVNLLKQLQSHVRRDFRLLSFYHSREAAQYKTSAKKREYNLPARRIPLLDERPSVRWKKQDDEIEMCPTEDASQHLIKDFPSTSSHI